MTIAYSAHRPLLLGVMLGAGMLAAGLALLPSEVNAQTPDSAAGTAPSQALSTPPDAAPINQPGAMGHADRHRAAKPHHRHAKSATPSPQPKAVTH